MRIFLFLILILFSSPANAQTFGETRQYFGDWLAACRPSGYCSATAYDNLNPPEGGVADYILRVGRHPTGTYWEVSLTTVAAMPAQYTQLFVNIDDTQTTFEQNFGYGAYSSINDFFLVSSEALTIVDQMAVGHAIAMQFEGDDGTPKHTSFSLSGISAALLWIDEQQSRIGSERVAYAAPIGLTPVSEGFSRSIPPELIIRHSQESQCDNFEDLAGAHRTIVAQTSNNRSFYLIPCTAGAYNLSYLAYEGDGTYFTQIYFADYDERYGWKGTPYLINPIYDRQTKLLTSHYLGRGIGDCGSSGTWIWDEYDFAMVEFRQKDLCDAQGELGVFPIIFQSNSQPPIAKPK